MGDTGDDWNEHKQARKEKRANNRDYSAEYLKARGIEFQSKNVGAHLVVQGKLCKIDFWPGTGLFIPRIHGTSGRGVRNLVKLCEVESEAG